jgi:hypothetical protein
MIILAKPYPFSARLLKPHMKKDLIMKEGLRGAALFAK